MKMTVKELIELLQRDCEEDYSVLIKILVNVDVDKQGTSKVIKLESMSRKLQQSYITVSHMNRTILFDGVS